MNYIWSFQNRHLSSSPSVFPGVGSDLKPQALCKCKLWFSSQLWTPASSQERKNSPSSLSKRLLPSHADPSLYWALWLCHSRYRILHLFSFKFVLFLLALLFQPAQALSSDMFTSPSSLVASANTTSMTYKEITSRKETCLNNLWCKLPQKSMKVWVLYKLFNGKTHISTHCIPQDSVKAWHTVKLHHVKQQKKEQWPFW